MFLINWKFLSKLAKKLTSNFKIIFFNQVITTNHFFFDFRFNFFDLPWALFFSTTAMTNCSWKTKFIRQISCKFTWVKNRIKLFWYKLNKRKHTKNSNIAQKSPDILTQKLIPTCMILNAQFLKMHASLIKRLSFILINS